MIVDVFAAMDVGTMAQCQQVLGLHQQCEDFYNIIAATGATIANFPAVPVASFVAVVDYFDLSIFIAGGVVAVACSFHIQRTPYLLDIFIITSILRFTFSIDFDWK